MSCSSKTKSERISTTLENQENLIAVLDTIWKAEQRPITLRDSLMKIYGTESDLVKEQQAIYEKNHIVNERKVKNILDKYMDGLRKKWQVNVAIGRYAMLFNIQIMKFDYNTCQ